MRRRGRTLVGGLAAGVLLALSLPPWPLTSGAWFLGLAGSALLYSLLVTRSRGSRLAVGLACGIGLYAPGLAWMRDFSGPGYAVAVGLESLILALGLVAVPGPGKGAVVPSAAVRPWRPALGFPAALVVAEAVRGAWPFGGLPLAGLDLGQVGGPLASAARLGGRLTLVALLGVIGVGLSLLLTRTPVVPLGWAEPRAGWRRAAGALALAAAVATVVAGTMAPDGSPEGRRRVAVVQGGGARGLRAVNSDERAVFDAHLRQAATVKAPVDLVLWPEDVIDVTELAGSPEDAALAELAGSLGATVVAGVVEQAGRCPLPGGGICRYSNAAVAWADVMGRPGAALPAGAPTPASSQAVGPLPHGGPSSLQTGSREVGRSEKVHRVPFGEYVPYRSFFSRLGDVSAVPRDATVGKGPGVLETPAGRLGVLISYEVFFGDRARAAVGGGAGVLLVPTNASSYRDSQVPWQQVAAARLRAIETGRWLVQAAPTGFSAVIDHRGQVHQRSRLGTSVVLRAVVPWRSGTTLALGLARWATLGLAVIFLVLANLSGIRSGSLMVDSRTSARRRR